MVDVKGEAARLLAEGKSPTQIRMELESKGYSTNDVAHALAEVEKPAADMRSRDERRNSFALSTREVFDRIGYGGATPQFVNILFWLSQQAHPYVLFIIGMLTGFKTLLSVVWSSIMQEYSKVHRVSKNTIAAAGIIFGFSFLFLAFGLLLRSIWLFSLSFLVGTIGVVAYGDLYQRFVQDTIRRERMSGFLRTIGTWGIIITALSLLLAGYLIDTFPMVGTSWSFTLFGHAFAMKIYGYLLAFEITAFSFILAGYVSSLVIDKREERKYPFWQFFREHYITVKGKMSVFADKYVSLLLMGMLISGFLQIIITAYSGIFIYSIVVKQFDHPFLVLAVIYTIAILFSVTGPFFTKLIHKSTGLAPTLVFGSLLLALLPLTLVYNPSIIAITIALCFNVIGGAIIGFAQGLLAQKLMTEETRRSYFQAQSFVIIIPYIILIPLVAWYANEGVANLEHIFLIAAGGFIVLVMPIYFTLVTISQKLRL
jgi:MFS family permease